MSKPFTTIIFDLFGTLVDIFSVTAHEQAVASMATTLDLPIDQFAPLWGDGTYPLRSNGTFTSIEENLRFICHALNQERDEEIITQAAEARYTFTRQALQPTEGVIETLQHLKKHEYKLGLISNCAPDVPHLWQTSPLAALIDVPIFSCEVKIKKPDARIYQLGCTRLATPPDRCLYIGDGSDRELSGARSTGMHVVRLHTSLADAYDKQRGDVDFWDGNVAQQFGDILDLLT